ncbi:MAG: hypothetical protein M0Z65_04040 [Firmicutes bacterium]|uniref:Uncharacterized protein n=1 Tax=Melghirimyces thermohalophilus TaxID=1236220 RepID=A0A1G6K332_9BACL|nr:hypothetical protein [Melghirimyces thermohalophilus]MDA8352353.1 hypothetical protein [Bacillota bacterium]SDC25271.1 hypothetical protein SAMN04488112_10542 [Melghirimyces thermohalophilus]
MRVELSLSAEEWLAALNCIERRYKELRQKILEGDRTGRRIEWYREEALLLERVLEELRHHKT